MKYRKFGNTGIEVSEIGMGCWAIGGSWGKVNDDQSMESLRQAYDLGCNFFDTANVYGDGRSERLIGEAFKDHINDIVIASKTGCTSKGQPKDFSYDFIIRSCEESLKRIGRDYIDVYQLHCPDPEQIKDGEAFKALFKLKDQGKIRVAGISVKTVECAFYAVDHFGAGSVQIVYNLFRHKPAYEFFPHAHEKGVGVIARVPLASGLLTDKFRENTTFPPNDHRSRNISGETFSGVPLKTGLEAVKALRKVFQPRYKRMTHMAIRWILDNPHVSTAIPGAKYAFQVKQNIQATDLPPLTGEQNNAITKIYKEKIACFVQEK